MNDSVPYFSQWESAALVADFVSGRLSSSDDPDWAASGAQDVHEYAKWASHLCGMACLKMIIAARTGRNVPILELARSAVRYGAYVLEGEDIRGLIYAPFVTFVRERFAIESQVITGVTAADVPGILRSGGFFMASVHPSIRWLERMPEKKGGHLVLVTAASPDSITFHNPSGHDRAAQVNAVTPVPVFEQYFAGRGIAILPE